MSMDVNNIIERRAAITGVGQSDIGRRLFRDPLELTLDGCLAAIEHAGLTTADIDGLKSVGEFVDLIAQKSRAA